MVFTCAKAAPSHGCSERGNITTNFVKNSVSLLACAAVRPTHGAITIPRSLLHIPPVEPPRLPAILKLPWINPLLLLHTRLRRALVQRAGVAHAPVVDKHRVEVIPQGAPRDANVCAAPVGTLPIAAAAPRKAEDVQPVFEDGGDGHPLLVGPPVIVVAALDFIALWAVDLAGTPAGPPESDIATAVRPLPRSTTLLPPSSGGLLRLTLDHPMDRYNREAHAQNSHTTPPPWASGSGTYAEGEGRPTAAGGGGGSGTSL